jgi:hypothetical protein
MTTLAKLLIAAIAKVGQACTLDLGGSGVISWHTALPLFETTPLNRVACDADLAAWAASGECGWTLKFGNWGTSGTSWQNSRENRGRLGRGCDPPGALPVCAAARLVAVGVLARGERL